MKNTRIGREFAYLLAKFEQIYLSPNCCFNGESKPSDAELGKLLIEPGCRTMTCPRCGKKLIVARRGTEKEFNKVDVYEYVQDIVIPEKPVQNGVVAASSCNSFDALSSIIMPAVVAGEEMAKKQEGNDGFIAGIGRTIRGLMPYAMRNPAILSGRNH